MDLDIVRVIKSIPPEHEKQELGQLETPWEPSIDHASPLSEHPRPQLARETWASLNGDAWEYAFVDAQEACGQAAAEAWHSAEPPSAFDGSITVPFSPEAELSGVNRQLEPHELLWYRRCFEGLPMAEGVHTLLHFDGVDYACAAYLNGVKLGEHSCAYTPFTFDITEQLRVGDNELALCVWDPSETGTQLRGKQRLDRGDMWYRAQSGIWKSVWLEQVPDVFIEHVLCAGDPATGELSCSVKLAGNLPQYACVSLELLDAEGKTVTSAETCGASAAAEIELSAQVPGARPWSPEDPYLYGLRIRCGEDTVASYCAFRTVAVELDNQGNHRFTLNGEPYFIRGLLDQGYWPDGLLTPPCDEAYIFDIQAAKAAGFNALRKHIKVESERFYYHCDRLGMLVLQDMPSGGGELSLRYSRDLPTLWRRSWHSYGDATAEDQARLAGDDPSYQAEWLSTMQATICGLAPHPCIAIWVLFNEGWGQFRAADATLRARSFDATRPILSCSGWYDQGVGDLRGIHNYFRKMHLFGDPFARRNGYARAELLSEFGGLGWHVDGHSCLEREYGYAQFDSLDEWRAGLAELLAQVSALEAQGLSGFVYTQISDVEEETNGLLTYDRQVNKLR